MACAAIVLAGLGLVLSNMHADCYSLRINIYSESRSAVINRKAAGEILLSFSLESPAALQVSGQLAMEMSHSHMSTQHVRCMLMKMCVSTCVCMCAYKYWKPNTDQVSQQMLYAICYFLCQKFNWMVNYCCR